MPQGLNVGLYGLGQGLQSFASAFQRSKQLSAQRERQESEDAWRRQQSESRMGMQQERLGLARQGRATASRREQRLGGQEMRRGIAATEEPFVRQTERTLKALPTQQATEFMADPRLGGDPQEPADFRLSVLQEKMRPHREPTGPLAQPGSLTPSPPGREEPGYLGELRRAQGLARQQKVKQAGEVSTARAKATGEVKFRGKQREREALFRGLTPKLRGQAGPGGPEALRHIPGRTGAKKTPVEMAGRESMLKLRTIRKQMSDQQNIQMLQFAASRPPGDPFRQQADALLLSASEAVDDRLRMMGKDPATFSEEDIAQEIASETLIPVQVIMMLLAEPAQQTPPVR